MIGTFSTTASSVSDGAGRGRLNSTNGPGNDALNLTIPERVAAIIHGGTDLEPNDDAPVPLVYGDMPVGGSSDGAARDNGDANLGQVAAESVYMDLDTGDTGEDDDMSHLGDSGRPGGCTNSQ